MNKQNDQKILVTKKGLKKLRGEYDQLINVERKNLAEEIRRASSLGDRSENAAYQNARERQSFVEGRILELEEVLKKAVVGNGEHKNCQKVGFGCKVKIKFDGEEEGFQIVGVPEANVGDGLISYQSPLGKALIEKGAGDEVRVDTPSGGFIYKIIEIQ